MRNPLLEATRRVIRRLGRYTKTVIRDSEGGEREIPAVWHNAESTAEIRKSGKVAGGRDFKASQKRLRVLTEDVENLCDDWVVIVSDEEFFIADHDHLTHGATILYLAPLCAPAAPDEDSGNGWR